MIFLDHIFLYTAPRYPTTLPPPVGRSLLIVDDSCSYSDTTQLVGLLWTIDQLVADTST